MLTYWVLMMIVTRHPDAPPLTAGFQLPPVSTQVLGVHATPGGCDKAVADGKLHTVHSKYEDTYFDCVVVQIPR